MLYSEFALSNELEEQITHTGILAAAALGSGQAEGEQEHR